ncbi:MAG: GGDEF domain-containing protein [Campylobacterota bacterium]|nr:GGDEF domain-containing protein [Campylobacterota bacterium]
MNISNISKKAIENLTKKAIDITPRAYHDEFCKLSSSIDLSVPECNYFKEVLTKLRKDDVEIIEPESVYDLIDILLQRIPQDGVKNLSELFQKSLQPSISLSIGDDLNSFCVKIGDSPSLLFEQSIQKEMEKFIQNRFEVDKQVVAKKTADIARLISLMNKYLSDAIDSHTEGKNSVSIIKNEIKSMDLGKSTKGELDKLQTRLVEAAITIENEMNNVNKNLTSGKNEVETLEKRVKELEEELSITKEAIGKDPLTGLLNRGAFDEKLIVFENNFNKQKREDFAVIFFDIDHFKHVNDTYGHDAGDVILKTYASLIKKLTRETDIVARYGGEEFVTIIKYSNRHDLNSYVNKIKNIVNKNKFKYKSKKIQITFSAGVELRSTNSTASKTVIAADKLLYRAKTSGRNKVVFWDGREL